MERETISFGAGPVERISFTEQERRTLALLFTGLTNQEIALDLGVSVAVVNQRLSLMARFVGLSGSRQLLVWCFEGCGAPEVLETGYRDRPLAA